MEICHDLNDLPGVSGMFPSMVQLQLPAPKETLAPDASAVSETEMRYAPAGYKFAVPLRELLPLGEALGGWSC